jgi:hypothetical protein
MVMTQEKANKIFETDLGKQLDIIYVTSDDKPFIRYSEAMNHVNIGVDDNGNPLIDDSITEWHREG